jgi:hypothetical protein
LRTSEFIHLPEVVPRSFRGARATRVMGSRGVARGDTWTSSVRRSEVDRQTSPPPGGSPRRSARKPYPGADEQGCRVCGRLGRVGAS